MKSSLIMILLLSAGAHVSAQLTIGSGTALNVNGTVTIHGPVDNRSTNTELTTADVTLNGSDETISTVSPVELKSLSVTGGGTKTIEGIWNVNTSLNLEEGILTVAPGAKLSYTGSSPVEGSSTSYINGFFYRTGSGNLSFPVGTSSVYAPVIINDASSSQEYGVHVIEGGPAFALPAGVVTEFNGHYWEFNASPGKTVSFSLNGMDDFLAVGKPVVLESPALGGIANSLSGTVSGTLITSAQEVSQNVVGIGFTPEFLIAIHDMITPFTRDEINDRLFIRNLEFAASNKVTLLDRYGAVVKEWVNYTNENDFDFSTLNPGSYICIVEYVSGGTGKSVVKGTVSILKSN